MLKVGRHVAISRQGSSNASSSCCMTSSLHCQKPVRPSAKADFKSALVITLSSCAMLYSAAGSEEALPDSLFGAVLIGGFIVMLLLDQLHTSIAKGKSFQTSPPPTDNDPEDPWKVQVAKAGPPKKHSWVKQHICASVFVKSKFKFQAWTPCRPRAVQIQHQEHSSVCWCTLLQASTRFCCLLTIMHCVTQSLRFLVDFYTPL